MAAGHPVCSLLSRDRRGCQPRSRRRVWSGAFRVTRNARPAGVARHVPAAVPFTDVRGTQVEQAGDLSVAVVGAEVECARTSPPARSSRWKSSWSGEPASSCAAATPTTRPTGSRHRPPSRPRQKATSSRAATAERRRTPSRERWPSAQVTGCGAGCARARSTQKGRPPGERSVHHRSSAATTTAPAPTARATVEPGRSHSRSRCTSWPVDLLTDVGPALRRLEARTSGCPGQGSPAGQPSAPAQKSVGAGQTRRRVDHGVQVGNSWWDASRGGDGVPRAASPPARPRERPGPTSAGLGHPRSARGRGSRSAHTSSTERYSRSRDRQPARQSRREGDRPTTSAARMSSCRAGNSRAAARVSGPRGLVASTGRGAFDGHGCSFARTTAWSTHW